MIRFCDKNPWHRKICDINFGVPNINKYKTYKNLCHGIIPFFTTFILLCKLSDKENWNKNLIIAADIKMSRIFYLYQVWFLCLVTEFDIFKMVIVDNINSTDHYYFSHMKGKSNPFLISSSAVMKSKSAWPDLTCMRQLGRGAVCRLAKRWKKCRKAFSTFCPFNC